MFSKGKEIDGYCDDIAIFEHFGIISNAETRL